MKTLVPGYKYQLSNFDDPNAGQVLQFIQKELEDGKFKTVQDGTTLEDMLEVVIDRLLFLQSKNACRENALAITKIEEALMWLQKRTADRIKRKVDGTPAS